MGIYILYTYLYTYVYIYIYICLCIYVYMYIHMYIHSSLAFAAALYRGASLIRNCPPPLGPPCDPRYSPTVRCYRGPVSFDQGTPAQKLTFKI